MKDKILINGGLGYIGSHTVVEMMEADYEVVIIDSLSNSRIEVVDLIGSIVGHKPSFTQLDLCDEQALNSFFQSGSGRDVKAIIHFAAHKNVGESVTNPLKYYNNNLGSLINTLTAMQDFNIPALVYSSSCSVYGNPKVIPVTEETPLQRAESPYGNTKKMGEEIIEDTVRTSQVKAISLRYFNPIGAHPSNAIGEFPSEFADNVMPALMATVRGHKEQFSVYGNGYNTADGTCIRDYIDVVDLAKAHVRAVDRICSGNNESSYEVFNLGTGKGASVMEMIQMVEKVTGKKLKYEIEPARNGDVEAVYANPALANDKLNWKAERTLEDMIKTSWEWSNTLQNNMGNEG